MSSGKAKRQAGKAKQDLGRRVGDEDLEAEGREDEDRGGACPRGRRGVRETIDGFREGLKGACWPRAGARLERAGPAPRA